MTRKPAKTHSPPATDASAEACFTWQTLAVAALLPLAAAALLFRLDVPLGCPGRFVYLYSSIVPQRLLAAAIAVLIAAGLAGAVWLIAARRRTLGFGLAVIGVVALAIWSYRAPPHHVTQHVLNAHSPSHDGAFVREALQVVSVREYLRDFPLRARTPWEQLGGTRVVSNPPGATLLAIGVDRLLRAFPALGDLAIGSVNGMIPTEDLRRSTALGLVLFWVLTGMWVLAGAGLYLLARLFFPPVTAAAFALCCTFSPMTLLFAPGKDPAQLLTVALPLYFWLRAYRRAEVWTALAAGVLFVPACLASLVHVWLAMIVVAATLLCARNSITDLRRVLINVLLPAAGAAILTGVALYALCDLNIIASAWAVATAQGHITRGPDAMPLIWQLLGIPLFVLFAGPACWAVTLWVTGGLLKKGTFSFSAKKENVPFFSRDTDARFGLHLLVATAVVMLATAGFTNLETPRLWIPFVPLLLLGGLLQLRALRAPGPRVALVLAALVGVQVAVSALQWSLMDAREAEMRLVEQRFYR